MVLAHRQERIGQIAQQVEAISHLYGLRRTFRGPFGIDTRSVTRNHANSRILLKPGSECLSVAVFEERNRATSFEIDDNRAIALAFAPGPVINPDHFRFCRFGQREPTTQTQKGIATGTLMQHAAETSARIAT